MSNAVNGIISGISFKPKPGGADQWGKTHFASLAVNGVTYDCGGIKPSPRGELQLRVQNGKDWVTLAAGDQVQFFFEPNGNYNRVKGKIMLVAMGNGDRTGQPATSAPASTPASAAPASTPTAAPASGGPSALDIRIEDGQVFNHVMNLLVAQQQEFTPNNIKTAAVLVRKCLMAFRAANCGRDGATGNAVQAQPVPATTPPPVSTPPPVAVAAPVAAPPAAVAQPAAPVEFNDDDIPF